MNEYELIYNFLHPDKPLDEWINESTTLFVNYYKSYGSLMDVVEKITDFFEHDDVWSDYSMEMYNKECSISKLDNIGNNEMIIFNEETTLKESIYKTVIEFIKLYNNEQK